VAPGSRIPRIPDTFVDMDRPMRRALTCISRLFRGTLAALSLVPAAMAADYCVSTTSQLRTALGAAASSAEDDVIKLVRGSYPLADTLTASINGGLVLRGGYASSCPVLGRSLDPSLTRIYGTPVQEALVTLRPRAADLEVDGISFEDLYGVSVADEGSSAAADGRIWIRRSRFLGNQFGLSVLPQHKNLRVENNLFLDNRSLCCGSETLNVGLAVRHANPNSAPIAVDVLFNTVLGSPKGVLIQGGGPFTADPRLQNNIIRASTNGSFALKIDEVQVAATNNVWGTIETEDGGGFASNLLNVNADPSLDAGFVPQAGSPALNSGTDFVAGGVPSSDHDGGPRIIGSRPDRGALESAISDIGVITVTSTADSGAGTLRQAILDSNQTVNAEVIRFNIGSVATCPYLITPASLLPAITSPVTIDGFSQPGSDPNGESLEDDAQRCVALGANLSHGLRLRPDAGEQMTIRGLAFFDFSTAAIEVDGDGTAVIEGNSFGVRAGLYIGPGFEGDAIQIIGAPGSRIGGEDEEQSNLIAQAAGAGVRLRDGGERTVQNNFIGLAANGYGALGNGVGIRVSGGDGDRIEDNWIAHSTAQGLLVEASTEGAAASGLQIVSNYFGRSPRRDPDPAIAFAAGNGTNGIRIGSGTGHEIFQNRVAHNGSDGIVVLGGALARFNSNRVHENVGQGIDLSPNGVDTQDPDLETANRGNRGQNFPVLESAGGSDGAGTVTGFLPSSTGTFTIQLFASRSCDATHGEGEALIGTASIEIPGTTIPLPGGGTTTVPVEGSAPFSAEVVSTYANFGLLGSVITATATRRNPGATLEDGATSEFSACIAYETGPQVFADGFED
jgi:hypothetical protein